MESTISDEALRASEIPTITTVNLRVPKNWRARVRGAATNAGLRNSQSWARAFVWQLLQAQETPPDDYRSPVSSKSSRVWRLEVTPAMYHDIARAADEAGLGAPAWMRWAIELGLPKKR